MRTNILMQNFNKYALLLINFKNRQVQTPLIPTEVKDLGARFFKYFYNKFKLEKSEAKNVPDRR